MILKDVGNAIKTQLQTISGLQIYSPTELRDSLILPAVIILLGDVKYHETLDADSGEVSEVIFRIILAVIRADLPSALSTLIDYIDTSNGSSIKAAIEADRTLSGTAGNCIILENKGMGVFHWSGIPYLGTEFSLKVWA